MSLADGENGPAATLAEPVAAFLRYLASEKRHSPRTCGSYRDDLNRFAVWVEDQP